MTEKIKSDISFSNLKREERISESICHTYDLIIIGGGITGAGIVLDAALRGMNTLLVEKIDFASGTSSKSTKLIHGGLRYLKQLEIGLVKESGLERAIAHNNIPHLVHPEKMLLPIVHNGSFSKFSASMAISVYDRLARVPARDRKVNFNKEETLGNEPILKPGLIKSSIQYSEYRTDDARLTIELIKAARREGAEAFNYMQVDDFIYDQGRVCGVTCTDHISEKQVILKAKQVVSAAGPWVDKLRSTNKSKQGKTLQLTKGVHVVLPKDKLPVRSAVYFDAFDGRMLFAIPRGKVTYVGTSDTVYKEDLDKVMCTEADTKYILKAVNKMFEVNELTMKDIISSWAGLRPLIYEEGKAPGELSRKDEVFVSDSDLISIAGGKLTGYRKMAERVVDLVQKRHPDLSDSTCTTENYNIHSDGFYNYEEFIEFTKELESDYAQSGISAYDAWYLATTYGKHARQILKDVNGEDFQTALIQSEVKYCIKYESCYRPEDYFNRRTGKLYFDIGCLEKHLPLIINEFQKHFNWDSSHANDMLETANTSLRSHSTFGT